LAVANYHDQHGQYPPAYLADAQGRPAHSWRVLLLPYLEHQDLYRQYSFDEPWDGPHNRRLAARMPEVYALDGEHAPGRSTTNYLAVVGPETVWPSPGQRTKQDVTDDPSKTILIVENLGMGVHWMEPRDLAFARMNFAINSPDGVSSKYVDSAVVLLDGNVRRLQQDLPPATLKAMLTIAGGESIGAGPGGAGSLLPDGRDREIAPR
jgi:hypothetical protein